MPSHPSDARVSSSRQRLLQAAKRLFAQQGYEQTATSAIAREAGTSESQLMRYFGGKVGLLEALFNESWVELDERIKKVIAEQAGSRETILALLQIMASAFTKDPDLAMLFLFEGRRLRGEEPRIRLPGGLVAFTELTRNVIRRGQATREFDPSLDANAITSALLGAAESMIRDRVVARVGGGRGFPEREVARTLDMMLSGFAGRAGRSAKGRRANRAAKTGRARKARRVGVATR